MEQQQDKKEFGRKALDFAKWCSNFFDTSDLDHIKGYLLEKQQQGLKSGRAFGLVCLPMKDYIQDGVQGWYRYTEDCYKKKLKILAYCFDPWKDKKLAIDFSEKTCWQMQGSKFGWGQVQAHSKWYYIAWRELSKQVEEYNHPLKKDDWDILYDLFKKIWDGKQFQSLKKMDKYSKEQKKTFPGKAFYSDDFEKSIWKPFTSYWKPESKTGNFTDDDIFNKNAPSMFDLDVDDDDNTSYGGGGNKKRKYNGGGSSYTGASQIKGGNVPAAKKRKTPMGAIFGTITKSVGKAKSIKGGANKKKPLSGGQKDADALQEEENIEQVLQEITKKSQVSDDNHADDEKEIDEDEEDENMIDANGGTTSQNGIIIDEEDEDN